jgi:hypothetical protein
MGQGKISATIGRGKTSTDFGQWIIQYLPALQYCTSVSQGTISTSDSQWILSTCVSQGFYLSTNVRQGNITCLLVLVSYSVGQGKKSTVVLVRRKYLLKCWSGKNINSVGQGKIATIVLVREKYLLKCCLGKSIYYCVVSGKNIYYNVGQEKISPIVLVRGNICYNVGQGKISSIVLVRGKYLLVLVREKYVLLYSVGQGKISTTVLVKENIHE